MANQLQGVRVAFVVANEGIEEVELLRPWRAVVDAGATPELVAPLAGMVETVRSPTPTGSGPTPPPSTSSGPVRGRQARRGHLPRPVDPH
jgi:protease I